MSSWYQQMINAAPDKTVFCTQAANTVEFALQLGSTLNTGSSSNIASFTQDTDGLVARGTITFQLSVGNASVSKTNAQDSVQAPSTDFDVTMNLSDMDEVENTCVSPADVSACNTGGQVLTLYTCLDLTKYVPSQADPNNGGRQIEVVSKGIRGAIIKVGGSTQFTLKINEGGIVTRTVDARQSVMQQMSTTTNCFPGTEQGCGPTSATPSLVYADGAYASDAINCVAKFANEVCAQFYGNTAPLRTLLLFNAVDTYAYTSGAWVKTSDDKQLYFSHANTIGVQISGAAACFPNPTCGAASSSGTAMSPGVIAAIVIACLVTVILVVGGILVYAHHHRHLEHFRHRYAAETHDAMVGGTRDFY